MSSGLKMYEGQAVARTLLPRPAHRSLSRVSTAPCVCRLQLPEELEETGVTDHHRPEPSVTLAVNTATRAREDPARGWSGHPPTEDVVHDGGERNP